MANTKTTNDIKLELLTDKIVEFDEFTISPGVVVPYRKNLNKIMRNSELFANICQMTQNKVESKEGLEFNSVLPLTISTIPYAGDMAVCLNKNLLLLDSDHYSSNVCSSSIKFNNVIELEEKVLLVIDCLDIDNASIYALIPKIVAKLKKYDAQIAGLLVIFDQGLGEYVTLYQHVGEFMVVIDFNDLCEMACQKDLTHTFVYEKYKFYSEKKTKEQLMKLDEMEEEEDKKADEKKEEKVIFPSQ